MTFQKLTPGAEKLLKTFVDDMDSRGIVKTDWIDTFSNQRNEYLPKFNELERNEYVNVQWADGGIPYAIIVNGKGMNYFAEKKEFNRNNRKEKFSSYLSQFLFLVLGAILTLCVEHWSDIWNWVQNLIN